MSNEQVPFTDRAQLLQELSNNPSQQWDVIVVGGGIIGAGVLREATRRGLKALLIEQKDFAWGTSSRSSKMVHGGLRYIAQGDIKLTKQSVTERERLLQEAPGLVQPAGNYFLLRKGQFPGRFVMSIVLSLYDFLAGRKDHRFVNTTQVSQSFPNIKTQGLKGAIYYTDTATDDARLVLRVLQESIQEGAKVLNYVKANKLIKNAGKVNGLEIEDVESGKKLQLNAPVVISATGAWADELRAEMINEKRIRPLRGSHLIFPHKKLPIKDILILNHPQDKRPVFVFSWEGSTVVGTTDLDHKDGLNHEAKITNQEVDYILQIVQEHFPSKNLTRSDVIASYAGVRPVIGSEKNKDPSKERRDHAVWSDNGLITVSGGKLTTFRITALDALKAAEPWLKNKGIENDNNRVFSIPPLRAPANSWLSRLAGRYGINANPLLDYAKVGEEKLIATTQFCMAECRWAAKYETVVHLDDLLLRRTRLGILLENGAQKLFPELEVICQKELGWSKDKWQKEVLRYQDIWQQHYSLPAQQRA